MGKTKWFEGDVQLLAKMWPSASRESLMRAFPGFTWKAITRQAVDRGLRREVYSNGARVWTPEDKRLLESLWTKSSESLESIAERLGRDPEAVKSTIDRLKLQRETPYNPGPSFWNRDRLAKLEKLWRTEPDIDRIAESLSSSYNAVVQAASSYGLSSVRLIDAGGFGSIAALQIDAGDAAYIAGFVDGEGCVSIYKYEYGYAARVQATNTNRKVLEHIMAVTGVGSIVSGGKGPRRKQAFVWMVSGRENVARLLKSLLPYMRVKRRQAELVIEYVEKTCLGRGENVRRRSEEITSELRSLNLRGA